ncbi:MAG: hypothetical protein P9F75_07390 [Candidatus Contendobacter sp.]|nr:hypothetical protein [Candidatus Contendobacter sp.]
MSSEGLLYLTFGVSIITLIAMGLLAAIQTAGLLAVPWWVFCVLSLVGQGPFVVVCWLNVGEL